MSLSKSFRDEFAGGLKLKLPANEHLDVLKKILKEHKLLYTLEKVHPKYFVTHPANRGKLMLSPHNVHRNAARIHGVGADPGQLTNALSVEMGKLRAVYMNKNKKLIARSKGLLAELNESERYASLGCGHTVAFCKTAGVGGITSEKVLMKSKTDHTIDVQKLSKNANFATMINVGWDWDVVPACVDEEFPAFAEIAQKALNTSNHTNTEVGELETCMILAGAASDPGIREEEDWKAACVEYARSLSVPCGPYCDHILNFVVDFGGGQNAPFITFMDAVAKEFGCNVTLGSSFWKALATLDFPSPTSKFPLIRIALALANMTSDKIKDGVARLLLDTDLAKFKAKAKLPMVEESEDALMDAMAITESLGGMEKMLQPLGRFFVRVGLKASNKEKLGREGQEYSLNEMKQLFLDGVKEIEGKAISFPKWSVTAADKVAVPPIADAADKVATAPRCSDLASFSDHQDPIWIANKAGLRVGCMIYPKGRAASPDNVYTIFTIGATISLHQVSSYNHEPKKLEISLQELLTKWSSTKAEMPKEMLSGQNRPMSLFVDSQKCALYKAIVDLDAKQKDHALSFWRHPDQVRTTKKIKQGQLTLVPVAPLLNLSIKNTPTGSGVSLGTHSISQDDEEEIEFFVLPPPKPTQEDFEEGFVAAFWWVTAATDEEQANMAIDSIHFHGFDLPILRNTIDIAPFKRLQTEPKQKAEPSDDAAKPKQKAKAKAAAKGSKAPRTAA